jgi:Spy/CpxP family protein refolding chaperone
MRTKCFAGSFFCAVLAVSAACAADAKSDKSADSKAAAAADTAAPAGKAATDSTTDIKLEGKIKGRIPNGWSKLKLTDLQKQEIYRIDETYKQQIEAAKKQVADLTTKREVELHNVLTVLQQSALDDQGDTKAKRSSAAQVKDKDPTSKDAKDVAI